MEIIRKMLSARTSARGLLLAFAVIAAVLAMHSVSASALSHASSGAAPVMAEAAAHDAHAVSPASETPTSAPHTLAPQAGTCDDGCGQPAHAPMHDMLLMACALALLVIAFVFGRSRATALVDRVLLNRDALHRAVRVLADPRPPSLIVLSISRT